MKFKIEVDTEAKKITAEGFTVERKSTWFSRFFSTAAANIALSPEPKQPKPARPINKRVFDSCKIHIRGNAVGFVEQSFSNNLEIREIVAHALEIGYKAGRGHREPVARIVTKKGLSIWGDPVIKRIKS